MPDPFECATIKATPTEAIIRFTRTDGTIGPTLHILATDHGSDQFALWAPGGTKIGDETEFTLLGLINAALYGADVL